MVTERVPLIFIYNKYKGICLDVFGFHEFLNHSHEHVIQEQGLNFVPNIILIFM